ncbi:MULTISPECIES: nucleoside permease [Sphingobacterium]|jgi:nucleoside transporter|uniref:nucleoside permease n=1 Tax=Sphingobacterium TaxID=28453 RepID=UPI0004E6018D|nr:MULTISPECIES: nucleoside permease [Sphingobacterium]UPZ36554.1 nucleoside permease [Sphingobacterium sp. PCS056]UXD68070.1 nucleoside permease [Sphingobacterium faecium]WGQ15779.1 nucleoside permease [Sphingobacterium faecium]CDS93295.1 putative nucleoside transporter YegT [Sphingobacterium sp. PM2-P1-29]
MSTSIRFKLSFMMFLEFFIWGAWFVTLGTYLSKNLQAQPLEIANVFSTQSLGAIIAPFIIGMIADRYFNAERILGVLHVVGAVLMYQMYNATEISSFYPYVLAYMVLYMPTLSLVNSVSFRQLSNPEKQFSNIRIWGTIGWIVAGLSISYLFKWDAAEASSAGALKNTFLMGAVASLVLGLFSFTLPKTPPVKIESDQKPSFASIIGLDAIKLLKDRNFLIFFISSILICIPLAFYYQNANPFLDQIGMENPTGKMTIGQISEVLFLLALPVFFSKFGFKKTILVGMLAWALRYILFAYGNAGDLSFMLILGIALHGICYDFFFVSGQIYTDSKAGIKYKSAAQGLITLATYGVGQLIGFWVAGFIGEKYAYLQEANVADFWKQTWIIPAGIAFVVFIIFLVAFKDEKVENKVISE